MTPVPKLCPPPPPKGAVCDFRLSYGRLFGRQTVVVAVNRDRAQLLRNADVFWRPRLAVQGDSPGPPASPTAPARWWHRGRWGRGRVRWFWGTTGVWGRAKLCLGPGEMGFGASSATFGAQLSQIWGGFLRSLPGQTIFMITELVLGPIRAGLGSDVDDWGGFFLEGV